MTTNFKKGDKVRRLAHFRNVNAWKLNGLVCTVHNVFDGQVYLTEDPTAFGWDSEKFELVQEQPQQPAGVPGRSTAPKPMLLPTDPQERKGIPITTGVLDYFPLAIAEVAKCSKAGNDQHNPGQPLHWSKGKSTDHADCIPRHLIDRGALDTDGIRHSAKLAWRALALLQIELENEQCSR